MRIFKNGDKPLKKNDKFLKYYREIDGSSNRLQEIINNRKNCNYFFNENFSEKDIKFYINSLYFSNATDMRYMFYNCTNLQAIPQLDTSNVTDMFYMFFNCKNLQTIPQLDTSNVTNMYAMFGYCSKLQIIDITSLDKVTSTSNISLFAYNCYSLTKLIIRNMTVVPPLNTNSFRNCYHFDGTVDATYNPEGLKDGRIYVPDDKVEELKQATNWSAYADIIAPLSSLEE